MNSFCFVLLFNAVLVDAINIQHHAPTNSTSSALMEKTNSTSTIGEEKRQFFGCGSYLSTNANYCYLPVQDGTVVCKATGSSTYGAYHAASYGSYGAYHAVDGQLSPGNSGFYHSRLEPYPWLKIELMKPDFSDFEPKEINRVEIYQRCDSDSDSLYLNMQFEVRVNDDINGTDISGTVFAAPRLVGGKFCGTGNSYINRRDGVFQKEKITITCGASIPNAKEVWIQKTTLHSHGQGWPNFNGNRWNSWTGQHPASNSNSPVNFLMINEVVLS